MSHHLTISEKNSDEELLNLWFEGDKFAFEAFFKKHSSRVRAYSVKKGIPCDDLDDVLQEVFIRLHKNIHYYERDRPALPWFFTLVHNTCSDWLRKSIPQKNRYSCLDEHIQHVEENNALINLNSEKNQNEERLASIQVVLSNLKDKDRKVFDMRNQKNLSFKEISERIGKTDSSLRKSYERTLTSIKKFLMKENGGNHD